MNTKPLPVPGQRVQCVRMDDPAPILPGTRGTVVSINRIECGTQEAANILVAWDNGRSLALLAELDEYIVLGS